MMLLNMATMLAVIPNPTHGLRSSDREATASSVGSSSGLDAGVDEGLGPVSTAVRANPPGPDS
jgi:hypothetical protein